MYKRQDTDDPKVTGKVEFLSYRPPMAQTKQSAGLYDIALRAAQRNGLTLKPRTHGGGSDGAFAADVGIPVIDGMGAEGEFSHTEEEYVKEDSLVPCLLYTSREHGRKLVSSSIGFWSASRKRIIR